MLSRDIAFSFIWVGNAPIGVTLGGMLMKVWKLLSAHPSFIVWLAWNYMLMGSFTVGFYLKIKIRILNIVILSPFLD